MPPKLGILAGGGDLPALILQSCRDSGRDAFVIAFEGHAEPDRIAGAPQAWVRLGAAAKAIKLLREAGVEDLVFAGPVSRPTLAQLRPDGRVLKFLAQLGPKAFGDDGLLSAVVRELETEGFVIVGADSLLGELLAPLGPLGSVGPDAQAETDIHRGRQVAHALGGVDVGQAVVVQKGVVLGVEAIEGTDALLARCALLRRDGPGGVLVKMKKPDQERRVDLPTIGVRTVEEAARAGLRGIAVEAGATLILDSDGVRESADAAGLFVVGVPVTA